MSWNDISTKYRENLINNLNEIKEKKIPVATISNIEIKLHEVHTNIQKNLSGITLAYLAHSDKSRKDKYPEIYLIKLKANIREEIAKKIDIVLQPYKNKAELGTQNQATMVEKMLVDEEYKFRWREIRTINRWRILGIDQSNFDQQFINTKSEPENKLQLVGPLQDLRIELRPWVGNNRTGVQYILEKYSINAEDNTAEQIDDIRCYFSSENDINDELFNEITATHSRALIARAVLLILWNIFKNNPIHSTKEKDPQGEKSLPPIHKEESQNKDKELTISPFKLKKRASDNNLFFSPIVFNTVATSINLGHHIILTGAPGCGKSRLAALIADEIAAQRGQTDINSKPKIVTATSAWTTGDVIGRYFPSGRNNEIEFLPGVFLQAIEEDRCLIIDEINRANIDDCFGELFTVLAGQPVELPYKKYKEEITEPSEEIDEKTQKFARELVNISIIPFGNSDNQNSNESIESDENDYEVSRDFRIIGTMNDTDRSALHQMSFALLRRFDVIRIDPPTHKIKDIIEAAILKKYGRNFLESVTFQIRGIAGNIYQIENRATRYAHRLSNKTIKEQFLNDKLMDFFVYLINSNITSIATIIKISNFYCKSISYFNENDNIPPVSYSTEQDALEVIKSYCLSAIAVSLVINIIPQLDALTDAKFIDFLNKLENLKNNLFNNTQLSTLEYDENNQRSISMENKNPIDFFAEEIAKHYSSSSRVPMIENFFLH